jgi:hypothetical protein
VSRSGAESEGDPTQQTTEKYALLKGICIRNLDVKFSKGESYERVSLAVSFLINVVVGLCWAVES